MIDVSRVMLNAAAESTGAVVVIDVLRAFTTAAFAFDAGAEAITVVSSVSEALALREENPDWLIMGEEGGLPVEGFDYDNSPATFIGRDLRGRHLIQRTSSGTQGVVRSGNARHLLATGLCSVRATVKTIWELQPRSVTMVITGSHRGEPGDEDVACGDYLEALIQGKVPNDESVIERVRRSHAAQKFLDPDRPQFSPVDLDYAMDIDRFSFAMVVERQGKQHMMRPVTV